MISQEVRDKIIEILKKCYPANFDGYHKENAQEIVDALTAEDEPKGKCRKGIDATCTDRHICGDWCVNWQPTALTAEDDYYEIEHPSSRGVYPGKIYVPGIGGGKWYVPEIIAEDEPKWKTGTVDEFFEDVTAEDEWEDGDPIHPGDYWLYADFNSHEGDQDGKDLTIGCWNGNKWVTRSDGIAMDWIRVIKWKPYEEIWPDPPALTAED